MSDTLAPAGYVQVGRYETQKSFPSAEVVQKLAQALETSTDYSMNGATDNATAQLSDKELLRQFKEYAPFQNLFRCFYY